MEPSPREVRKRMPSSIVGDYSLSRAVLCLNLMAMGVVGVACYFSTVPIHAWLLSTFPLTILFWFWYRSASKDYRLYYDIASDDLKLEYDAKIVENAMNKVEGVEFRELVRDPAVMRQLLSAFDHIEVGIENVTVKYRGKDIQLRACRLWRDGDKLRISR